MATVLDELFVKVGADLQPFGNAMNRLEKGVARARQSLDSLAAGAAKIGAPLAAGAGVVVKTLYNFEAAMNQVQATLGVTMDDICRAPAARPNSARVRRRKHRPNWRKRVFP